MPEKDTANVEIGEIYTAEEIAELGFATTNQFYAGLPIYKRNSDRCLLKPLGDGRFKVDFTYQF